MDSFSFAEIVLWTILYVIPLKFDGSVYIYHWKYFLCHETNAYILLFHFMEPNLAWLHLFTFVFQTYCSGVIQ